MAADRRIDPAGGVRIVGEQFLVERLAHAVQPLELVALGAAGRRHHARHRQRIVGGELREDARARREQAGAMQSA